jgi:hypothetical protein
MLGSWEAGKLPLLSSNSTDWGFERPRSIGSTVKDQQHLQSCTYVRSTALSIQHRLPERYRTVQYLWRYSAQYRTVPYPALCCVAQVRSQAFVDPRDGPSVSYDTNLPAGSKQASQSVLTRGMVTNTIGAGPASLEGSPLLGSDGVPLRGVARVPFCAL